MQICKQFNCPKLTYHLNSKMQEQPARNAFEVLMQSRNERRLPGKINGDKLRGDQRMYNDFIDLLGAMNIGWTPDLVGSVGEKCIEVAVSALWYIDPCRKQFVERSIYFPTVLDQFQGYNDWKAKKQKKTQLSIEGLNLHLDHLTQILNQPWIFKPQFNELYGTISQLADGFNQYRTYLKQQANTVKVAHSSLTPTRTISESIELNGVPVVSKCDSCYSVVQASLEKQPMYSLIFLNEFAQMIDINIKIGWQDSNWSFQLCCIVSFMATI